MAWKTDTTPLDDLGGSPARSTHDIATPDIATYDIAQP
jgi:hypothetical protein